MSGFPTPDKFTLQGTPSRPTVLKRHVVNTFQVYDAEFEAEHRSGISALSLTLSKFQCCIQSTLGLRVSESQCPSPHPPSVELFGSRVIPRIVSNCPRHMPMFKESARHFGEWDTHGRRPFHLHGGPRRRERLSELTLTSTSRRTRPETVHSQRRDPRSSLLGAFAVCPYFTGDNWQIASRPQPPESGLQYEG